MTKLTQKQLTHYALMLGAVLFGAICFACSMNFFYRPGNIYSSGVPGLSQLITYFTDQTALKNILTPINLFFALNVPLLILSYFKIGKQFTFMTLVVIGVATIVGNLVPVVEVSHDPLLNAIAGGVLSGAGVGVLVKFGMSSGGFDIIAVIVSRATGRNVGAMSFMVNMIIIIGAGLLFSWEYALYTLIALFVSSRVIDSIHTNEQRLTAFIVTKHHEQVIQAIQQRVVRGVTILEGEGAYSRNKRPVLMVVVNRYELLDLQEAIEASDSEAFVNIVPSFKVHGRYLNRDQQVTFKQQLNQP